MQYLQTITSSNSRTALSAGICQYNALAYM